LQPVHIGSDHASAFEFAASESCSTVKNWASESKARDAKRKAKW